MLNFRGSVVILWGRRAKHDLLQGCDYTLVMLSTLKSDRTNFRGMKVGITKTQLMKLINCVIWVILVTPERLELSTQ